MATYGSTLDSLMANRLADETLAARERSAYRDYLNAMANTNIRSREQEAMDRYRQGELGSRNLQTQAYRDVGLGQSGAYRDVGLNQGNAYRDVGLRGYDVQRELGLGQQGVQRDLGLKDIGVRYELGKGQLDLGGRQLDVNRELGIGGLDVNREQLRTQLDMAKLPYDRIPAYQERILNLASQNPAMARGVLGIEPSQLDLLNAVETNRQNQAYQDALTAEAAAALADYEEWSVFDSARKNKIQDLIKNEKLSPAAAARKYAVERIGGLQGRTVEQQMGTAAPASNPLLGRGSNNPPVSITAPATNAALRTNLISAPQARVNSGGMVPSMKSYEAWLLESGK